MQSNSDLILRSIRETAGNLAALEESVSLIEDIGTRLVGVIQAGGKVLFCGNGGSAADAQHLAAELEGRFLVDRPPLPAVALTVNTSSLTAIANDYGYDDVFVRQVRGLGTAKDALVGISTSGNSTNVINALVAARGMGMLTIGFSGQNGGKMEAECDLCLKVPSVSTPRIQEMHILAGHIVCHIIENAFTG